MSGIETFTIFQTRNFRLDRKWGERTILKRNNGVFHFRLIAFEFFVNMNPGRLDLNAAIMLVHTMMMCVLCKWKESIWHVSRYFLRSHLIFWILKVWIRHLMMKSLISVLNVITHSSNLISTYADVDGNGNIFHWFSWLDWYCTKPRIFAWQSHPCMAVHHQMHFKYCIHDRRCEQIDCLRSHMECVCQAIQEIVSFAWYVTLMCALLESAKRNGKYDIHFFCSALFLLFLQIVCVVRGRCDNFFFRTVKVFHGWNRNKRWREKKNYA